MMKFVVFDSVGTAIYAAAPILRASIATSLGVSLVSGAMAGVASAVVSQPGREGGRKEGEEGGWKLLTACFFLISIHSLTPPPSLSPSLPSLSRHHPVQDKRRRPAHPLRGGLLHPDRKGPGRVVCGTGNTLPVVGEYHQWPVFAV